MAIDMMFVAPQWSVDFVLRLLRAAGPEFEDSPEYVSEAKTKGRVWWLGKRGTHKVQFFSQVVGEDVAELRSAKLALSSGQPMLVNLISVSCETEVSYVRRLGAMMREYGADGVTVFERGGFVPFESWSGYVL